MRRHFRGYDNNGNNLNYYFYLILSTNVIIFFEKMIKEKHSLLNIILKNVFNNLNS